MSNGDEKLPPKNYINSGISRSLLTPCRRVGLSRTKKTPNNTPEISPQKTSCHPLTISGRPNITDSIDSQTTPKRCFILQSEKYSDITPVENTIENNSQATDSYINSFKTPLKDKFPNCRRIGLSRSKTTPKDINSSSPQNQIVDNVKEGSNAVTKNAKRCLNSRLDEANSKTERNIGKSLQNSLKCQQSTNILKSSLGRNQGVIENHITSTDIKNELPSELLYKLLPDLDLDINTHILSSNCLVDIEPDSPPKSPVFSEVSVLVHYPASKKSIDISEVDKLQDQPRDLTEEEKNQLLSEILEENDLIVKSKKLKLDSVNFETNENIKTKTVNHNIYIKAQASCSSVKRLPESSCRKSNETSKLTRFTTEDYLEEYSKNSHTFKDSLKFGDTKNISSHIDSSDSDDFQQLGILRSKNNKESCTEKQEIKKYMPILCPLSEYGGTSETTKDLSESLFKVKDTSPKYLTVSLEKLSNKCIKDNGETSVPSEDNHIDTQRKTIVSKLSFQTDDSDDDIFTSSPESNQKQRENLMQLISTMKKEIKQKEETLERLKQAQAYKKMHNTEELNTLKNRWIQGCKTGLEDLLVKLMEHGPMEMDLLMKNLMIPDDIVKKMKLL